MTDQKGKQFAKNSLILAIGNFSSKILSLFLLPIYTTVLSTDDYGNVDFLQSIISLAIPIVSLQLGAALFRFLIDAKKTEDRREIVSSALLVILINGIVFFIVANLVSFFFPFQYSFLFIACFVTSLIYVICQNVVRAFGNNVIYSVCSFLFILISAVSNIVFILGFGMKGASILLAIIIANAVCSLVMIISEKLWIYCSLRCFSRKTLKELTDFSLPCILNETSWWIANFSDRLLIVFFLGAGTNGIYAAANKVPNIYTSVHSVFNLAWQESAAQSINSDDREEYYCKMVDVFYRFFGCLVLGIICIISLAFELLYGKDYSDAYPHVAIFVNSLCATYGGIFSALKKTGIIGMTTAFGAVANVLINLLFIRYFGLFAASVSTLVSYLIILVIRIMKLKQFMTIRFPIRYFIRFIAALCLTLAFYYCRITYLNAILLVVLCVWSVLENRIIISGLCKIVLRKIHPRRQEHDCEQ